MYAEETSSTLQVFQMIPLMECIQWHAHSPACDGLCDQIDSKQIYLSLQERWGGAILATSQDVR